MSVTDTVFCFKEIDLFHVLVIAHALQLQHPEIDGLAILRFNGREVRLRPFHLRTHALTHSRIHSRDHSRIHSRDHSRDQSLERGPYYFGNLSFGGLVEVVKVPSRWHQAAI